MTEPFRHEALIYRGDEDYLAGTLPFVEAGLDSGAMAVVAVTRGKVDLLRASLGEREGRVRFADMGEIGENPGAIISAWRDFVDERGGTDRPLWAIGEPAWPERSAAALDECHRHECLLNVAFADTAEFRLLCPYDAGSLAGDVISRARLSHPTIVEDGGEHPSADFGGLDGELAKLHGESLPEPAEPPIEMPFNPLTLDLLREAVRNHALDSGVRPSRADDLVLAANELAANSVRHAGGGGRLRMWREGSHAVYEVQDRGRLTDQLAGRQRPRVAVDGGHGLWLVHQLCDLVQVRSAEAGTVVRLHMRAGPAAIRTGRAA